MLVKVGLLPLLGLGDAVAGNFHQVVDLLDKVISSGDLMGQAREEVQGLTNVLAKGHQVGGEAGGGGLAAVDGQLIQAEVRGPGVGGAGQDKTAKDLFAQSSHPFGDGVQYCEPVWCQVAMNTCCQNKDIKRGLRSERICWGMPKIQTTRYRNNSAAAGAEMVS